MDKNSFLYRAHCEGETKEPSSKRLYGGIGFVTVNLCIAAAVILSFIHGTGIGDTLKDLLEVDLFVSASLIGLKTIMGKWGSNSVSVSRDESKDLKSDDADKSEEAEEGC